MGDDVSNTPEMRRIPFEVELDRDGKQILSLIDEGPSEGQRYARYVDCAGGCGFLIGCGDAVESASHLSCATLAAGGSKFPDCHRADTFGEQYRCSTNCQFGQVCAHGHFASVA